MPGETSSISAPRLRKHLCGLFHDEARLSVRLFEEPPAQQPQPGRSAVGRCRPDVIVDGNVGRMGIVRIMPRESVQQKRSISDAPHEHAHVVE